MGLGTRVRPRWLVIAGSQDMLAGFGGVGRSDMLPPGEPRDGRAGSGVGGLLTSRGGLTGESKDCRARPWRGGQKMTRVTRRTSREPQVPESAALRRRGGRSALQLSREKFLRKKPALCKRAGADIQLGSQSAVCQALT